MSEENVEIAARLRRGYDAYNRCDFDALEAAGLSEKFFGREAAAIHETWRPDARGRFKST